MFGFNVTALQSVSKGAFSLANNKFCSPAERLCQMRERERDCVIYCQKRNSRAFVGARKWDTSVSL